MAEPSAKAAIWKARTSMPMRSATRSSSCTAVTAMPKRVPKRSHTSSTTITATAAMVGNRMNAATG